MPSWILTILLAAIENAPTLINDAKNVFDDIAHGEGGPRKVAQTAAAFSALAAHAANAAATVSAIAPGQVVAATPVVPNTGVVSPGNSADRASANAS